MSIRDLPLLGEPRQERENWSCGYADAPCARDAVWHGIVLADPDPAQDIVGLASCDEHLWMMKLTADFIHPHEHPCGIDGSRFRWPENECYTDWDDGAELAQVALVQVSAPRLRALAPAERLV